MRIEMEKDNYKYVIVGAGVSGLSTAYELSKTDPGDILVLDKEDIVGGLCRTVQRDGSFYDLGSHRIHDLIPERILAYIREVSDGKVLHNTRGGKLRLRNSFITYPIKSFQFFLSLGLFESIRCALSLLAYRLRPLFGKGTNAISDYETYLISKAGKRAYKIFYEPYALKVWGCDPKMISTTAVKKRMSMTNPILFIRDILSHMKKTDLNYYYYLDHGIGDFAKGIEKKLAANGVGVVTNVRDFQLEKDARGRRLRFETKGGERREVGYDTLVSTIPLDELVLKLAPEKEILELADKVHWRGLKLVYVHLKEEPLLPGETFYFPEVGYLFGRISIPKRFSDSMQPDTSYTSFVCEVPCSEGDEKWKMSDEDICERIRRDLMRAELIRGTGEMLKEKNFVIGLTKVYPLFIIGWQKTIGSLLAYLQARDDRLYVSGKGGFFLHCNMDHSIDIGLRLARAIQEGQRPEAWYRNFEAFHSLKLRD